VETPTADFTRIFEVLAENGVDFVIVGGLGAVLQGAPISTFDVDIVHSRDNDNVSRLEAALRTLSAYYRGRGDQRIEPGREQLVSPGHQLLMTVAGPLDLLGTVGEGVDYSKLLTDTVEVELSKGVTVRVLSLHALIKLKEALGRDKDLAVLAVLRRTLEEKERSQ
jgi:predicted nucleotidyltransferase